MTGQREKLKTLLGVPFVIADKIFKLYTLILSLAHGNLKHLWLEYQKDNVNRSIQKVQHQNGNSKINLEFYTPNAICRMRTDTFSNKEPETLAWIDAYTGDGPFFDIGANIGLYSIYFAKTKNLDVYCFEPSVFNLRLLIKNSYLNGVHDKLKIIPNALSNENGFANFNLSTEEEGGALSSFQVDFGWDGKPIDKTMTYLTAGFTLDYLVQNGHVPEHPALVKIDVDGFEHILLKGAVETISSEQCRTILVEINDQFKEQAKNSSEILQKCGFHLKEKIQSECLNDEPEYQGIHNQIWVKK